MDLHAIGNSLAATREGLEVAGYSLLVAEQNGRLSLMIAANEGACEDCLVPKPLFLQMVRDEIAASGEKVGDIDIVYPTDRKSV